MNSLTVDNVTIRPAQQSDLIAYRNLRLEALRNHPEAFGSDYEEQAAFPIDYWQERLHNTIDNSNTIIYFATANQDLIGMVGIGRIGSVKQQHAGVIWGVYVQSPWRGLHVAQKLIEAGIAWGQTQHLRWLKLAVITTNVSAVRCYLHCGFTVYGVDPEVIQYNGEYFDELLMARQL